MAIQDRKINVGGAGLQNRSQERSVTALQPTQGANGVSSLARLASSIGAVLPAIAQDKQKEADAEALRIFTEAQIKAKKEGANRDQVFAEARQKVAEGQGRGFFDRLLTDEDESVKVFDRNRTDSEIYEYRTRIAEFRASNPNMTEAEVDAGIGSISEEYLAKMASISPTARDHFLDNNKEYLNKLRSSLSAEYFKKTEEMRQSNISKGFEDRSNMQLQEYLDIDIETLAGATVDINSYNTVKEKLTEKGIEELAVNIRSEISHYRDDLLSPGSSLTKEQAGKLAVDRAVTRADQVSDINLFNKVVTMPDEHGITLEQANPEYVQKLRQKLNSRLQTRARSMESTYQMSKSKAETERNDSLNAGFEALFDKVESDPSPENISELNNYVQTNKVEIQDLYNSKQITSQEFNSASKIIDSWEFSHRAKMHISRPEIVRKADDMLFKHENDIYPMSEKSIDWVNKNVEHMTEDQAFRFSKIVQKELREKDTRQRRQSRLQEKHVEKEIKMTEVTSMQSIWNNFDIHNKNNFTGPDNADRRQLMGIADPPDVSFTTLSAEVYRNANGRRDEIALHKGPGDYKWITIVDEEWAKVTEKYNKQLLEWQKTLPSSKATSGDVVDTKELQNITDGKELEKKLTATISSFGSIPAKWPTSRREEFAENILPQIQRRLDILVDEGEIKKVSDLGSAIERMVPNISDKSKEDLHRMALTKVWANKLTQDAKQRARDKEVAKIWPELGRAPESLEEWLNVLESRPDSPSKSLAIKDVKSRIKKRDAK